MQHVEIGLSSSVNELSSKSCSFKFRSVPEKPKYKWGNSREFSSISNLHSSSVGRTYDRFLTCDCLILEFINVKWMILVCQKRTTLREINQTYPERVLVFTSLHFARRINSPDVGQCAQRKHPVYYSEPDQNKNATTKAWKQKLDLYYL